MAKHSCACNRSAYSSVNIVGIADILNKYGTVTASYLTAFFHTHIHNYYYAYCRRDK
jgi:hypothetical protein